MVFHPLLTKAASTVVTGVVGVTAVDALRRLPYRQAAVTVTAWGLRGTRQAEAAAENARLAVADVIAEAKDRIGEQATPPVAGGGHDHEH